MKRKTILLALTAILTIVMCSAAFAMPILEGYRIGPSQWFNIDTDSDGVTRRADAVVSKSGSSIIIDLYNNAPYTRVSNQVLTGIFFDYAVEGTLGNPNVTAGSFLSPFPLPYGRNLNGEWSFRSGINGLNGGLGNYGILASSLDPLGFSTPIDESVAYTPPDYPSETAPGGSDFGIVSGDLTGLVPADSAYVLHHATISFDVYAEANPSSPFGIADPLRITKMNFVYGTDYEGENGGETPIPEPGTLMLLGSGLVGVAAYGRKKFRK